MGQQPGVQAVERALALLDAFAPDRPELAVGELAVRTGLPRPTVSRLVATLARCGYLELNAATRKYALGTKVFRLGGIVQSTTELQEIATPLVRSLRDQLGESSYLDIVDGYERVSVISFEATRAVRTVVPLGQRGPLHAGADGRVLLAWWDEPALRKYVELTGLPAFTERTLTDPRQLLSELQKVREQGYAVSWGEYVRGSASVAAPVREASGRVVAGLAISFPDSRADQEHLPSYIQAVEAAARAISTRLGYAGP